MTKRTKAVVLFSVLVGAGAVALYAAAGPVQSAAAEKVPMLDIRAISGEKAGESFCYVCAHGNAEYAVVFVQKWNGMVAGFAKQLEELKADHPKLGVAVILLDRTEGLADRVRTDLGDAKLTVATIGIPDGEKGWADVKGWAVDNAKQTNAVIVVNREAKARFTAGCPHCDHVAAQIAESL